MWFSHLGTVEAELLSQDTLLLAGLKSPHCFQTVCPGSHESKPHPGVHQTAKTSGQ